MADEWIVRRLRLVDEPVSPDASFAADLYAMLAAELGFSVSSMPQRPIPNQVTVRRRSRLPELLLVAAILVAGAAAGVAGVGGLLRGVHFEVVPNSEAPHVCELVSADELSAIVGSEVALIVPESSATTSTSSTRSCLFEYDLASRGAKNQSPNVTLSITRYADAATARDQAGQGIDDYRAIPDLGDAAAYYENAPNRELWALHGRDVLSIGGMTTAGQIGLTPAQMVAIARIIVGRL